MKRLMGNGLAARLVAGLAAALAMATTVQAAAMVYTISGVGFGSLGGVNFTDAAFDIRLVGDTDNLQDFGVGAPSISPLESATVRIGGFADAVLTGSTRFGLNRDFNVFFLARDDGFGFGLDLFDFHVTDAQEMAFDYASPYGPVAGSGVFVGQFQDVGASQGSLTFQSASGVTFSSAAFGAAVPEPAAWALMIAGFGLAGASLRTRAALRRAA
jgi:hypothetical protein